MTLRRTMLFFPGNNERFLAKAIETEADSLILDLEDAVTPAEKAAAREMVKKTLQTVGFRGKERAVRINGVTTAWGGEDIWAVVEGGGDLIVLPKADSEATILAADQIVAQAEEALGVPQGQTKLMPLVETALGVLNVERTAFASDRIVAISFGGADYRHSTRAASTPEETEYYWPETKVMLAARAAGKMPIGTAYYLNISDIEAVVHSAQRERAMGYEGKTLIHPTHVKPIKEVFTPTAQEIEFAQRVIEAFAKAEREGRGAITVDGRMIEHLHVTEARWTLEAAHRAGVLKEDAAHPVVS